MGLGRRAADVAIASRVAARSGIEHVVVDGMTDDGWRAELRKNRMTSFCADEHVWYLPVADRLAATTRTTHDGVGGDILSAQLTLAESVVAAMRALLGTPNAWSMFFSLGGSWRGISLTPHATLAPLNVHTP